MAAKTNVAIVTGGKGAELEISLASAKVVAENLSTQEYNAYQVNITEMPWTVTQKDKWIGEIDLNSFSCQNNGDTLYFDVVFMAIHGTPAEDGKLQGYFDVLNIPYTCCSPLASAITFDKDICKQLLAKEEVLQAKSVLINTKMTNWKKANGLSSLQLPVFVKPNKNGSSYGISKVAALADLDQAVKQAFFYDDEVLIEEFIDGRELACGVFEMDNEIVTLPITEIISENEFFDYEAKYLGKSKEITPADLDELQEIECARITKSIYRTLKLKGACRVDYFLVDHDFYLLEVNTIPGLSAESLLPQQAKCKGFELSTFFGILIKETLKNHS